jgi:hypothetical protein
MPQKTMPAALSPAGPVPGSVIGIWKPATACSHNMPYFATGTIFSISFLKRQRLSNG